MKRSRGAGFTIVEVLVVLVIAGVILTTVLVAVGQLRRNSRDLIRKRYVTTVVSQYSEYFKNNRRYPMSHSDRRLFIDTYIEDAVDPSLGSGYSIVFLEADGATVHTKIPPLGTIYLTQGHWCNEGEMSDGTGNPITGISHSDPRPHRSIEDFVVWAGVESGRFFCIDNSR